MAVRETLYKTFSPTFGTGAPNASTPTGSPYYDSSVNPYIPYVWNRITKVWNVYSIASPSVNATQLQGVDVDATPPTNGQYLQFNGVKYAPH